MKKNLNYRNLKNQALAFVAFAPVWRSAGAYRWIGNQSSAAEMP